MLQGGTGLTSPQLNFGCGDLKCVTRFKQISFLFPSSVKKTKLGSARRVTMA